MLQNDTNVKLNKSLITDAENKVHIATIDYFHQKIHEGKMLFASHVFEEVIADATVYLRHISGSSKYLHSVLEIASTGEWEFVSYAGTTYTANGTVIPQINRKSDSTYVPEATFYHTPTIDVLGTPRLSFLFGSGTNPAKATTSEFGERLESVFAPGVDVLIGLTNKSGATQNLSAVFNYYEEE